ncbi:MAG: serine/threonine protein kinase, partial [Planctomycetota bacterium]|nr:serine/threonine protein kinase [Planctomycetota bacterium]
GLNVPGFSLIERLGEGAYGEVWLAREDKTGKHVAIKFYTHRRGLDWSLLNREVEKLALLYTSRNIVRLIDVGWQSDPPHYVMEYLERGSLETLLAEGTPEPEEAVRIIRSVCQALVHAHGRGVLHCDLKPANVLLDSDLEPRLCDFGQSRLSHEQNPALGTLFYMAPEQASLNTVPDARWDVYALGALLFQLLTGKPPFRTPQNEALLYETTSLEDRLQVYREIVTTSPRPREHHHVRSVDRRLAEIVDRCLHLDPERRYSNAQAMLDVLYIRERQRRVQPLVAMGGIGPAVILLAMFLFASRSIQSAVSTTGDNLTARALESDVISVTFLASGVEKELQDRLDELVEVASSLDLRTAIEHSEASDWSDRATFQELLDGKRGNVDARRDKRNRQLDTSWFFVDANGFQRWRNRFDPAVIDKDFSYRDYFHGHSVEYERGQAPPGTKPIQQPYISLPFKSKSTFRNMVALSVPVWDQTGQRIIGVLARTTHLEQLLSQYRGSIRGSDGVARTIALADNRNGQLLDHSRLAALDNDHASASEDTHVETFGINPPRSDGLELTDEVAIPDETLQRIRTAGNAAVRMEHYQDPLRVIDPEGSNGEWLAAFASVGETDWTAIVQERRSDVLRPVVELQSTMRMYAWIAFGIAGTVVAMSWYLVLKSVNERGIRHWSRSARRETTASDTPST